MGGWCGREVLYGDAVCPAVIVIGCGAGSQAGVPEAVEAGNLSGFGLGSSRPTGVRQPVQGGGEGGGGPLGGGPPKSRSEDVVSIQVTPSHLDLCSTVQYIICTMGGSMSHCVCNPLRCPRTFGLRNKVGTKPWSAISPTVVSLRCRQSMTVWDEHFYMER